MPALRTRLPLSALASAPLGLLPATAHAYVGPGVGLALLGPFFTLLCLVAIALLTLLFFPLRRLIFRLWRLWRRHRPQRQDPPRDPEGP